MIALLLGSTSLSAATAQTAPKRGQRPAAIKPAAAPLPIVTIAYEKFTLPNGLTVIVHEDHKVPVVSVATYYHVGSANETPGRTGFAHLFEHLMFNGSEHANDDWFKFMNEIGATGMNGSTGNDRTNYYQTVPKSGLDRVLWYESDRMGNLLPAIDQAKLDEQRKVVQNEKRQGANSPKGALPDLLYASIYPAGHPYSWTPIGSMEDLNAASLDDVKTFFKKWYGPSNAVLVLSGDITVSEARDKAERFYGNIPAGPALQRQEEYIAKMVGNRRATLEADVTTPQLVKVWNVPGWSSRDAQVLRLAASALADGENSPMEKRLVRDLQLASNIDVSVQLLELGSQFVIEATARPGVSLAQLETAIDEEMAKFLRDGISQATLDRIKFQRYAANVRGQTSTMGKAQLLAEAQLYAGTPDFATRRQEFTRDATPETLLDTARKWLSDGSFTVEVKPFGNHTVSGKPVDRAAKPPLGRPDAFSLPPLQGATLSNGIKVLLAERHDVPTVTMSMMFDIGALPERDPAKEGLSTAFALASTGTTSLSALEISQRQQELSAGIAWQNNSETTRFGMNVLKPKLDEALDLYADILLHPSFTKGEWDRLYSLFKANFEENKRSPGGKLALIIGEMVYGPGHPYASVSTPETVGRWTVDDFRAYYRKWIRPDLATILIVGDTSLAEMMPKLEQRFGGWRAMGPKPVKAPLPPAKLPARPRIVLADQPGAESSLVSVVETGPARAAADYDVLNVVNTVIGGNFVSRLNLNLREEKGWSYGAKSQLTEAPLLGQISAGAVVQTDKTADSMREIERELRELGTTRKPTAAEIAIAKNAMLLGLSAELQDPGGAMNLYRNVILYGLPDNYWNDYVQRIDAFTPEQVQAAATRLYRPNELTWFVVGDLSKIEADIRKLNFGEVMVYNADGKRVR
nr:pitrilysin family protein [Sphingomonas sp.]